MHFHDLLHSKWEITELGKPKFALGIAISHDHPNRTVTLSQTAKIDKLINEYNQMDSHSVNTSIVAGLQLH